MISLKLVLVSFLTTIAVAQIASVRDLEFGVDLLKTRILNNKNNFFKSDIDRIQVILTATVNAGESGSSDVYTRCRQASYSQESCNKQSSE